MPEDIGMQQPVQIKVLITHFDPLISAGLCLPKSRRELRTASCSFGDLSLKDRWIDVCYRPERDPWIEKVKER
jgi:hypothetical protein